LGEDGRNELGPKVPCAADGRNHAELYWSAHLKAAGIKFFRAELIGDHVLWVLDFDECFGFVPKETGVEQAAERYLEGEHCCLRPESDELES